MRKESLMLNLKFLIVGLVASILAFGCACTKKNPDSAGQKPLILVSIAPYQMIVERVAGKEFLVQTVVPPGTNPHAYEPTSKQTSAIGQGLIWFCIGEPFEQKILPVLKKHNPSFSEFDLRSGIDLLNDDSRALSSMDHQDRHIWLSPKLAAEQAKSIVRILSEKFPDHRELFRENAKSLVEELNQLDQEIAALLESVKDRALLVSHPAFGYFCRDYHLEQLSVEFEGKDPRPKHLEEILQRAIDSQANLALALPQHNNKGTQLIAKRLHVPIRMIDPYSPHYFETLRFLAHLIADPQYQQP